MTRSDWLLLLAYFAGSRGLSPVKLQKSLFLLSKQIPDEVGSDFYQFTPYHYGPFDSAIYGDADALTEEGWLEEDRVMARNWSVYKITDEGIQKAESLLASLDERLAEYLKTLTVWILSMGFMQLLGTIYKKYPEYAVNSVFRP